MDTVNGEILDGDAESFANSVFDEAKKSKFGKRSSQQGEKQSVQKDRTFFQMLKDKRFAHNKSRILHLVLCSIYIISPIDLIPDVIIGLGQIDDLMVLGYGMKVLHDLVKDFKTFKSLK